MKVYYCQRLLFSPYTILLIYHPFCRCHDEWDSNSATNHLWNEHFQTVKSVGKVMVRNHQVNLQLHFEDVKYVDRFLWWDICHVRMALQINSNLEFSSALSSAPIVVPDTYSQKVIPAPIWMKVQLEGTLPVSTIRGQGKDEASARHCYIHDWILKNHWSEGRSDS